MNQKRSRRDFLTSVLGAGIAGMLPLGDAAAATLTVQELKNLADHVAWSLLALPGDQLKESLTAIRQDSPVLHALVKDKLSKIVGQICASHFDARRYKR